MEIARRLAAANPAAFEPHLAMALNNLGVSFSNLGQREPARAASDEALEIYRRLAAASPAAFEHYLARGLLSYAATRTHTAARGPDRGARGDRHLRPARATTARCLRQRLAWSASHVGRCHGGTGAPRRGRASAPSPRLASDTMTRTTEAILAGCCWSDTSNTGGEGWSQ